MNSKKTVKDLKIRELERQKELEEKKKQLQCFRCGKKIPKNHPIKKDKIGRKIGRCLHKSKGGCWRKTYFVTPEEFKESEFKPAKEIIKDEHEKQKKFLKDPELLIKTIKEVQNNGVAGEEDTIITLIIIASTRLVKNATPESRNLLLSDTTGIGKDHTTKKVLKTIIPEKNHLHVTKMSNQVFTYWHADEKDWSWDGKVIHFEDITQDLLNCSTFKVMASGNSKAAVLKDQKVIEPIVNGKPCMILTSHHANLEDEGLRRFPIGSLNDTIDQTKRVKDKISKAFTGREINKPDNILRSALISLDSYSVIIPYAELIQHFFPDDILMRTHFHRFLIYICASAVFHQAQRKKTENGELITTPDDYMIARLVLIYTTSNPKMIPMSKEYRDVLTILQENVEPMSVAEIFLKCDKSKDWLYRNLAKIVKTKLVVKSQRPDENANKNIVTYQYSPGLNFNAIPTWYEIQQKIDKIINKTKNTKKTDDDDILEKWFSDNKIKPRKPKNKKDDGFSLVFLGHEIPFNRKVFAVFLVLRQYLRERDEKRYSKYFEERDLDKLEKINKEDQQKTLETIQNENTTVEKTGPEIDLSKYKMTIQQIEKILGSEKLPALQIARRMNKKSLKDIDRIERILKQVVSDSSFETTLKIDSDDNYFNENREDLDGK